MEGMWNTTTHQPHRYRTAHSEGRMRQRGIRGAEVDFIYTFADRDEFVGGGCIRLSLSKRLCKKLVRDGWPSDFIASAAKIVLIVDDAGFVRTNYHAS